MARGNGGASSEPRSIFDDVEALKAQTAAKLGEERRATSTELVLCKPKRSWYFRAPADETMLFSGCTWEDPDNRELTYFIAPALWDLDDFEGAWKTVTFVPYVTAEGVYGVWPVSTLAGNGYNLSAWAAVQAARTQWVRLWAVQQKGIYRHRISDTDFGEPKWSGLSIFEMLRIVFKGREVLDEAHPLILRLRGQS
jgi:hypothetical protein